MTYLRALKYGPDDRSDWVYRAINDVIKQIDNASHGHLHSCIGKQNNAERSVSSEVFRWCVFPLCPELVMEADLSRVPFPQASQACNLPPPSNATDSIPSCPAGFAGRS